MKKINTNYHIIYSLPNGAMKNLFLECRNLVECLKIINLLRSKMDIKDVTIIGYDTLMISEEPLRLTAPEEKTINERNAA